MQIYISADIEGCTGVVSWRVQCGGPDQQNADWDFARRMMTHDVNAAIRGAAKAGATLVVVKDSHNVGKNLLIDELETPKGCEVQLISGARASLDGMMDGIDSTFDAAFLVGYHAMAGTAEGVMEHSISGRIHRCWVNGLEAGEQTFSVFTAGAHQVPVSLVVSDDKGCAEAKTLFPGIETAVTKHGMGRHIARLLHPSVTGPAIEEAARRAISGPSMRPIKPAEPVTVKIEFNRSEEADEACLLEPWSRLDAYTIKSEHPTWLQAHNSLRRAMSLAGTAST